MGSKKHSLKRGEKNRGANVLLLEKQKENAVRSFSLKKRKKHARIRKNAGVCLYFASSATATSLTFVPVGPVITSPSTAPSA